MTYLPRFLWTMTRRSEKNVSVRAHFNYNHCSRASEGESRKSPVFRRHTAIRRVGIRRTRGTTAVFSSQLAFCCLHCARVIKYSVQNLSDRRMFSVERIRVHCRLAFAATVNAIVVDSNSPVARVGRLQNLINSLGVKFKVVQFDVTTERYALWNVW